MKEDKLMSRQDKRFWIWESTLTLALSAMPLIMYGENISVILLIVVSYTFAAAVGLIASSKISVLMTFMLIFGTAAGTYIIDLIIIDTLRLVKMESYPLIVGQIYLLPICLIANALICTVGGLVFRKINKKRKDDKL